MPIQKDFQDKLGTLTAVVKSVQSDLVLHIGSIHKLEAANIALHEKVLKLENKLKEAEQYSRRNNLIIAGIPTTLSEVAVAGSNSTCEVEYSSVSVTNVLDFCHNVLQGECR